jgi:hypothetical protein
MKTISKKETNYSLHNNENYKKELDYEVGEIREKITELLIDYFKFIIENIKAKQNNFSRFIIIRGLDTVINIFNITLFYTKNLDATYFHCQKAFYFYVEFVGQISEDEKIFLQLSSRDATTYVYKKTLYEISNEIKKKNEQITESTKIKLDIINYYIEINRTIILKLINDEFANLEKQNTVEKFLKKINSLSDKSNFKLVNNIIENFYYKLTDFTYFFEVCNILVKKISKNEEIMINCSDKFSCDEFNDKIKEKPEKFVNWIIS